MLLFSCKKASRLISDSLDRPLTFRERCALRFHLCICRVCRRFRKQVTSIDSIKDEPDLFMKIPPNQSLPPEKRERIKDKMNEIIKND